MDSPEAPFGLLLAAGAAAAAVSVRDGEAATQATQPTADVAVEEVAEEGGGPEHGGPDRGRRA